GQPCMKRKDRHLDGKSDEQQKEHDELEVLTGEEGLIKAVGCLFELSALQLSGRRRAVFFQDRLDGFALQLRGCSVTRLLQDHEIKGIPRRPEVGPWVEVAYVGKVEAQERDKNENAP